MYIQTQKMLFSSSFNVPCSMKVHDVIVEVRNYLEIEYMYLMHSEVTMEALTKTLHKLNIMFFSEIS